MKPKLKPPPRITDWTAYEKRVRQLESEGMSRSDAQSVADAEIRQKSA
jgi:ribosomal protein S30